MIAQKTLTVQKQLKKPIFIPKAGKSTLVIQQNLGILRGIIIRVKP